MVGLRELIGSTGEENDTHTFVVRCSFPARFTFSELVDRIALAGAPRTGNSWDRSRGLVGRLKPAASSRWQSKSMAGPLNHRRPNHPHQPGQGIRDRPSGSKTVDP